MGKALTIAASKDLPTSSSGIAGKDPEDLFPGEKAALELEKPVPSYYSE